MVSFDAYTTGGTSQGSLAPAAAMWDHRQAEDGFGRMTVNGTVAAAVLAETIVIRVNDGTADRFAFVSYSDQRRQLDGGSDVELSGPGVRHLLHAGQVLQEDTSDCALAADMRWFGWMSGDYDDGAWIGPQSHGRWKDLPFETPRPEGFPARHAEYLWRTTDYDLGEEDVLFRQTFTVATEGDYVLVAAADDEYEAWLDGTKLPMGSYGSDQLYQWSAFDEYPVRLCAGTHTLAIRGRNLPANVAGQNPAWVIWAVVEASGDGSPASANDIHELSHDAESGTWTIRILTSDVTSTLDWDATASEVQAAIETQIGAGNVTVSGSGTKPKDETYELYTDATSGTLTVTVDGEVGGTFAYNATPAQVEAAFEQSAAVQNVTCNTGSGTSGSPWIIAFDGADAETSFSVSIDDSNLNAGASATLTEISNGTPSDPWVIEFVGAYANRYITMQVDGSGLVGGTLTKDHPQSGHGAAAVVVSDTSAKIYDPSTTEPGMTPGHILKLCLDEARARGTTVLDNVTDGFSATLDSGGDAWGFELNLPVPLPSDIHRVAVLLEEQGIDVWMDPDLTLQCDDEQGVDDTVSTTFTPGVNQVTGTAASQEESTVKNVVRLRTTKGWVDVSDAASVTARGRWESGLILDGFDTAKQAEPHTNLLLNDLSSPQRRTTFDIPSEASVVPYADFGLGDRVNGPVFGTSGFATTDVRVVGIAGRLEEKSIVWTVETVD